MFAFKAEDLYRGAAATDPVLTAAGAWWPLLISTEPCSESVRRCAMSLRAHRQPFECRTTSHVEYS